MDGRPQSGNLRPMARTPPSRLRHLGRPSSLPVSPQAAELDRVPNPHPDTPYVARFTAPEFTTLCPITGQPDFAHLVVDMVPGKWLVESKSFKLYLASYRNIGTFHEDCTVAIGKRLVEPDRADMAAHRWLLVSARRHPDRRVLADRPATRRGLGAGSGRRPLSGPRLSHRHCDRRASAMCWPELDPATYRHRIAH